MDSFGYFSGIKIDLLAKTNRDIKITKAVSLCKSDETKTEDF